MDIFRELSKEYLDFYKDMGLDVSFDGFEDEFKSFPKKYFEPNGCILIAWSGNKSVGCIAVTKMEEGICELKRLFVREEYRKQGVGSRLISEIIIQAKKKGYLKMRLDTVERLEDAYKLYLKFNFKDIERFNNNPFKDVHFLELSL